MTIAEHKKLYLNALHVVRNSKEFLNR